MKLIRKIILVVLGIGVVFCGSLIVANKVLSLTAEPGLQTKIFVRNAALIEATVNDWLTNQTDIIVDHIKASTYGSDYAVVIHYYKSANSKTPIRIKIFSNAVLGESTANPDDTIENIVERLLFSLGNTYELKSVDLLMGTGPWDIFVVYDQNKPILNLEPPAIQQENEVTSANTDVAPEPTLNVETTFTESKIIESLDDSDSTGSATIQNTYNPDLPNSEDNSPFGVAPEVSLSEENIDSSSQSPSSDLVPTVTTPDAVVSGE